MQRDRDRERKPHLRDSNLWSNFKRSMLSDLSSGKFCKVLRALLSDSGNSRLHLTLTSHSNILLKSN